MAKTLADMTDESVESCFGMWADFGGDKSYQVVLKCWGIGDSVEVVDPNESTSYSVDRRDLAPRTDLPRAWNPDGTPVKGKWENTRTPDNPHDPLLRRRFISEYEDRTND